jgi:hypothetical protein
MSSRPQRTAAVIAEVKMATAGVPERKSRSTKPSQAPKEPAVLQKKRKVAHLTQLAQVAPLDAERVRVKRVKRVKIQPNRSTGAPGV